MSCTGVVVFVLLAIVAKHVWSIYVAIKHPEAYRDMRREKRERRQRRGKVLNAGLGITNLIGKRKGWW